MKKMDEKWNLWAKKKTRKENKLDPNTSFISHNFLPLSVSL